MSSPARISRRLLSAAGICLLAVGLTGCFRPLYGDPALTGGSTGGAAALSTISVEPIEGFLGHELRNELAFELTGGEAPADLRYRLVVVPLRTQQGAVVDTLLGRSESVTNALTAQYKLFPVGQTKEVTGGRVIASVSYDRTQQRFAGVRAERDSLQRGAKVLAEQIRTQLAVYFASKS